MNIDPVIISRSDNTTGIIIRYLPLSIVSVLNLTGVLRVPTMRIKALNLPSKRSHLVTTPSDIEEMKLLRQSNKVSQKINV